MLALRSSLVRSSGLPLALACCSLAPAAQQHRESERIVRLNAPLDRLTIGSVLQTALLEDGSRAIYRADLDQDDVFELWSSTTGGSASALRLNGDLDSGGHVWDFALAPGSNRVVYLASQRFAGVNELFSVPADRSRPPFRISGTLASQGDVLKYSISADGTRVAYLADQTTNDVDELYATVIDPPVQIVKLNGSLTSGGDVRAFAFSADASHAVYLADQDTDEVNELYAVDGSLTRVKLNAPLVAGGDVGAGVTSVQRAFAIAPGGTRVVYRADQLTDGQPELFSVPIDASLPPVRISDPSLRNVVDFAIDPTGLRVAFTVLNASDYKLFSVPIDGSQPPLQLASALVEGSLSSTLAPAFRIAPDGTRVVYRVEGPGPGSNTQELHSAPLDGSAGSVRLDPAPFAGSVVAYAIRPDGAGVVFRSFLAGVEGAPVFHVPIDGSALPNEISAPFVDSSPELDFAISPDSQRVVYIGAGVADVEELFSVPCDGSTPPTTISAPLVVNGAVDEFVISADGSLVLYRADQEVDTVREAFGVPPDGSGPARKLHPDLPLGPIVGDVFGFELTPDGQRVVYAADQEGDALRDVYSVPIDASAPSVRLIGFPDDHSPYRVYFQIVPDGIRVVLQRDSFAAHELFVGPIDGSTNPTLVATTEEEIDFKVSPDGAWIVYREFTSHGMGPEYLSLFAVPTDGSALAVVLTPLTWGIGDYAIVPNSDRVLYLRGGLLFSVPLDASAAPVQLSPSGIVLGSFLRFAATLAPDGQSVVYRADKDDPGNYELYRVSLDGSSPPVKISGTLSAPGVFSPVRITADSTRAVYFQSSGAAAGLASARLDAIGSPLTLAAVGAVSGDLELHSGRAVYSAAPVGFSDRRLFSVPVDGSAVALDLSGAPPTGSSVGDLRIAPDGSRAVYEIQNKLFSVPIDGSQGPIALLPLGSSGSVWSFEISADSRFVFLIGNLRNPQINELFRASIDRTAAPVRLNGDLVYHGSSDHGSVTEFRLAPDGRTVVYQADQDEVDVLEIFARQGVGGYRSASAPPGLTPR